MGERGKSTGRGPAVFLAFLFAAGTGVAPAAGGEGARVPLAFEPNCGQAGVAVSFICRARGYHLFLTPTGAVLKLGRPNGPEGPAERRVLRISFAGAAAGATPEGLGELRSVSNYFFGNDPDRWVRRVPHYSTALYRGIYPGTDLVFYDHRGQVEYDFRLAPGADPGRILLDFEGADALELDAEGDLLLRLGGLTLRQKKPSLYQEREAARVPLPGRFVLRGPRRVGFEVEGRDPAKPLVIDPQIVYATFLGGTDSEDAFGAARDPDGNLLLAGYTHSIGFPTEDPLDPDLSGSTDAVVLKLDPQGALVYSTYLGGTFNDDAWAVAADTSGNAYLTGESNSSDFPISPDAAQTALAGGGGDFDVFVAKLSAAGDDLIYATYLGGSLGEIGRAVAVDASGNAIVCGETGSTNFPRVSAFQTTKGAGFLTDGFVTKVNAGGTAFIYSSYLGGNEQDIAQDVAVDGGGNAYLTGLTRATDFPLKNAYQGFKLGNYNAFITRVTSAGALSYSTYLGGFTAHYGNELPGNTYGRSIAVDSDGFAYVAGSTDASDFPLVNPLTLDCGAEGCYPAFVAKMNPAGSGFVYSTLLGPVIVEALALDPSGSAYVAGYTSLSGVPVSANAYATEPYALDAVLMRVNGPGSALLYASYLGGSRADWGRALAVESGGKAYLVGQSNSPDFPVTSGAYSETLAGGFDLYVAAIDTTEPRPPPPLLVLGESQTVELTLARPKQLFRLEAPGDLTLVVTSSTADPLDAEALYFRWGAEPTTTRFDRAAEERDRSSQRLVIPPGRSGTGYLLVKLNRLNGVKSTVTVRADGVRLGLESLSTRRAGAAGVVSAVARGSGFGASTVFSLVPPGGGAPVAARRSLLVSPEEAELEFPLEGVASGSWSLRARDGAEKAELAGVLEVTAETRPGSLSVRLGAPESYRSNRVARLSLAYENTGDRELAAPLLKVAGPAGSSLRLESDTEFRGDTIQVLATDPRGVGGRLPPGAKGEISLVFRMEAEGEAHFSVFGFSPNLGDYVGWDQIERPAGITDAEWRALAAPLSVEMGARWVDYRESLGRMAARLRRRAHDPASVRDAFRLAVCDALGSSGRAALVGQLRSANGGLPLARVAVGAVEDGFPVSSGVTDAEGFFTLECLEPGRAYQLRAEDHRVEGGAVTIPAGGGDLLGLRLAASPEDNGFGFGVTACGGPEVEPLSPPAGLFLLLERARILSGRSHDPNEKDGPEGQEPGGLVGENEKLVYTIHFENRPAASAPAQVVVVTDQLDRNLDWSTFRVREATVADRLFDLDRIGVERTLAPSDGFGARRVVSGVNLDPNWSGVEVSCEFDPLRGRAVWRFQTVNPLTGELPPPESLAGFLSPNTQPPMGEGQVSFTIEPREDLGDGDEVRNEATITFDDEAPITTNETVNTFARSGLPLVPAYPYPPSTDQPVEPDTVLRWFPPVGAVSFDLYFWTGDVKPATPAATGLTDASWIPEGLQEGTLYHWQIVARDEGGASADGEVWSFRTVEDVAPPAAGPNGLEPAPGAAGVVLRPTLRWESVAGAAGYAVYFWTGAGPRPEDPLAQGLAGTELELPRDLEPGKEYRWQVVAENRGGAAEGIASCFRTGGGGGPELFIRGDANGDGAADLSDAIFGFAFLFLGGTPPACLASFDVDDNDTLEITDGIVLLGHLFLGSKAPAPPFPGCGPDPTPGAVDCGAFERCR